MFLRTYRESRVSGDSYPVCWFMRGRIPEPLEDFCSDGSVGDALWGREIDFYAPHPAGIGETT